MKIRPVGNNVAVERVRFRNETRAGIHLPTQSQMVNDGRIGRVVAVGEGKRLDNGTLLPIENVKVGDIIAFHRQFEIQQGAFGTGPALMTVPADAIVCIIEDAELADPAA